MGMNVGNNSLNDEPEPMMDINTTPLIDVMLVLIIMLIITIPIQLHSVNLDMPSASKAAKKVEPVVVNIQVQADRTVLWDGVAITDRIDLERRLTQAQSQQPQPELHIRSDAKAPYEAVMGVMASAQRIGLTKLGIVGSEQFID